MTSRYKAELECKQDLIMLEEFESGEIFSNLYYKRINAVSELNLKARNLKIRSIKNKK